MSAEKGNTYATVWTEEIVLPIVKRVELLLKDGIPIYEEIEETKVKQKIGVTPVLWIGQALAEIDDYNLYREIWSYWKKKFSEETEVFQTIKKVDGILETRLVIDGLEARNPVMRIFLLKAAHGLNENLPGSIDNPLTLSVNWLGNHAETKSDEEE